MTSQFDHYPQKPKHTEVNKAFTILCNTHNASSSFLDIFDTVRKTRRTRGASTDEEQDLLRAMLIFSASGIDSMIKQLIRDALPSIINKERGAKEVFKSYIEKKIIKSNQIDSKLLAAALIEREPRTFLIQELVLDLISNSLQSKDELLKAASFFDIPSLEFTSDFNLLKNIFNARNQIAHEMDIDFDQPTRNRRSRRRADMVKYTNEVFRIAEVFLKKVDSKL